MLRMNLQKVQEYSVKNVHLKNNVEVFIEVDTRNKEDDNVEDVGEDEGDDGDESNKEMQEENVTATETTMA